MSSSWAESKVRSAGVADVVAAVSSAVLTMAAYRLWLGWHEPKHLVPGTTNYAGPHESWQVIGLTLTLVVIAAVGGWLLLTGATVWATSIAVSFMLALEAATMHQDDASLWPIGTAMLFVASLAGLYVVSLVFQTMRRWLSRSA